MSKVENDDVVGMYKVEGNQIRNKTSENVGCQNGCGIQDGIGGCRVTGSRLWHCGKRWNYPDRKGLSLFRGCGVKEGAVDNAWACLEHRSQGLGQGL